MIGFLHIHSMLTNSLAVEYQRIVDITQVEGDESYLT